MNKFKIKPLKGFSLVELLVSIVIIAAITMLISSAFIGMMAQKKNLQVKETAEDMTREIISAVTRNNDNLDLLLKKLKTETPGIIGTAPISQTQYQGFKYCPELDPAGTNPPRCTYKKIGWRIDLTDHLKLNGSNNPNVNQDSYNNTTDWLKFVPGAEPLTTQPYALLMDNTVVPNRHPGDTFVGQLALPNTEDGPEFRFFKKPPSTLNLALLPKKERYRYGIFSLVDITSLNMKMKLLPKNTKDNTNTVISWNTKVYLHVATDSEGDTTINPPDYLEPKKANDKTKKSLVLTAEVKYSLRNNANLETDGTSVTLTKKFQPSIMENDSVCMGSNKSASCPQCRANPWSSGCNPCETYNISGPNPGSVTSATSATNPAPGSTPQPCFVVP